MPRLSLHPGYSASALLVTAVLATVLVAIFYRRAYRVLRPGQWTSLYVLRMTAIGIVLLLMFRPVFSHQRQQRQRFGVTFLVDRSASMGITDEAGGGTRLEHVLDSVQRWRDELADDFETHVVAFAEIAEQLDDGNLLQQLQARGESTSLSRGLDASVRISAARELEAIFLISDGNHNASGDPAAAAGGLGVPVNAIGVGNALRDRSSFRDLRVSNVEVPDQMPVGNLARVKAYVEAEGFPGRVVAIVLDEDGEQVARQELVLDNRDGAQEVTFEFAPTDKGLHQYRVRTPEQTGERIPENNQRTTSSLVVDARISVLYVEGTLRAEYGAVVGRFLSKDPNIEFCALVQTRPNVFMQRSNIEGMQLDAIPDTREALEPFDVFIIGDLDSTYFRFGQMELISHQVRAGAGLVMLGGYHSLGPGGYQGTPLEDVLPVVVGDRQMGQMVEPFQLHLTPLGRLHPIFANITPFFPGAGRAADAEALLPELQGCVRVRAVKPGATVLAIHPTERIEGELALPVMAVQPVGEGRAAVFTGDTTRNWHQTLRSQDRETPFLRFWGQLVRWLARRDDEVQTEAGVSAVTDKSYYEPEAPVAIRAVVRGAGGEATSQAQVSVNVRGPQGQRTELSLAPRAGPAGNYEAVFETSASGRYELEVEARLADDVLRAEPLRFDVGRPNLEFDRLNLDEDTLATIARVSGGRYAHLRTADRLIQRLVRRNRKRSIQYEVPLYWPPLMWVSLVAALTTEWLLRRKYQLR